MISQKHLLRELFEKVSAVNSKWEFDFVIKGSLQNIKIEVCSQLKKNYSNKEFVSKYSDIRIKLYEALLGPPKY